jgi:hypothetical protein
MPTNVAASAPALLYSRVGTTTDPPTTHSSRDEKAKTAGLELRKILVDGADEHGGHYSYVNYAYGGEYPEEIYGKDNLKRLRALKEIYDPENRFRYYGPVVPENGKDEADVRDEL